ncbi:hypothetical protein AC249_AIPGENE10297 [Exaiptasia diaphana]|nr:hypothetical protein AC249_AIPGENE10297 [Exaiptasia diaphana]
MEECDMEVQDFVRTGRTGRRNAMPDVLSEKHGQVTTAGLAEVLDTLNFGASTSARKNVLGRTPHSTRIDPTTIDVGSGLSDIALQFAALSFSDNIRRNMDQGQLTGAVFIDLRKAFDTVDHAVLLDKLSNLGILNKELDWFTDYLPDRTQAVEFQGVTSTPEVISVGLLSPIL